MFDLTQAFYIVLVVQYNMVLDIHVLYQCVANVCGNT